MMSRKIPLFVLTAIVLAGFLPAVHAQSEQELLDKGMQALNAKNFAHAQELFSILVKEEPTAKNFAYLAVAESGVGNLGQAIADFRRSIELGNDSTLTRYGLGSIYLRNNEPEAAIHQLRLVIARDPTYVPARYALGVALLRQARPREAIPYLEQAQRKSPGNAQRRLTLVQAQFEAGNPQAAVKLAEKAAEAIPENPQLLVGLAKLCLQYQEAKGARNLLETAIELQPNNPQIRLLLANVCLHTGDSLETLALLKDLPPGAGKPGEAMLLAGEARTLTGDLLVAEADLSSAIKADPRNAGYVAAYAWFCQVEGQYNKALAILKSIKDPDGETPDILYQMAVSYYFLGKYAEATATCEVVIRSAPRDDRSYALLGLSKLEQGKFTAAQVALERAISSNPEAAAYHLELGEALLKSRMFRRSEAELNLALALDPHAVQAYFWRGQVFARLGERKKAIEDLETSTALEPKFVQAYSELARLYAAQGQTQKARAVLNTQRRLEKTESPNERNRFLLPENLIGPLP